MRKEGKNLVIEPADHRTLLQVLATLSPIDDDFPPIAGKLPIGDVKL